MSGLGEWDLAEDDPAAHDSAPEPDTVGTDAGDDPHPELYFDNLDEFVREIIVPVFRRRVGDRSQFHWAADWWRHPEAVLRLDALWRSWEHLRLDPALGMSVWLRDHADYHLAVLLSDYGPFAKSHDTSDHGAPLPYEPPPAGLF